MKATSMAIFGGLLKGVGSGLQANYDEKRQMALANLKRAWDQEDAATLARTNAAAEAAKDERQHANKIDLLERGGEQQRKNITATATENRVTNKEKAQQDAQLERVRSQLRSQEDRASRLLEARLGQDDVQSVQTAEDGSLIIVKKNGGLVSTGVKLHIKEPGGAEEGGSIADARTRRDGGKPAPKPAEQVENTSANANRLRTLYANATPKSAPGMFKDGKKIPYAEFERLMKGGQ